MRTSVKFCAGSYRFYTALFPYGKWSGYPICDGEGLYFSEGRPFPRFRLPDAAHIYILPPKPTEDLLGQ
jgi:hypothetical protein